MTIPDNAIEAAARALAHASGADDCFERVDEWEALEDWEREAHPDERPGLDYEDCSHYRRSATATLTAAAPFMSAQAKAEALREAADVLNVAITDYGTPTTPDEFGWAGGMTDAVIALRARAATIEGEKP